MNKLREALGDSAENPVYIETLSRRGYRFIAPVLKTAEVVEEPAAVAWYVEPLAAPQVQVQHDTPSMPDTVCLPVSEATLNNAEQRPARLQVVVLALALVVTAAFSFWLGGRKLPTVSARIQPLTQNGHFVQKPYFTELFPIGVSDGIHLFVPKTDSGELSIATIPVTGGVPVTLILPAELVNPALSDISADHSRMLVRSRVSSLSEQQLWIVPTTGNSAQQVGGVFAHDATWMPDGSILFANGDSLYTVGTAGENRRKLVDLPGRAFWLRWNPAGRLLRFTISDPATHTSSLWQMALSDLQPHRLFAETANPSSECCGVWSTDGTSFTYQSRQNGSIDLWRLEGESSRAPVRITDGPLDFGAPIASPNGKQMFFVGSNDHSELDKVMQGALVPVKNFLSRAYRVQFSSNRRWVTWTDEGRLWRADADGAHMVQLTPPSLDVFSAAWSPDDTRLALMARAPGKAWKIYVMPSGGGEIEQLETGSRNAADPSWTVDGFSIVFGRINDELGREKEVRMLHVLDLRTGAIRPVSHSENLFSPRCSPDGNYIAALTLDQHQLRLFNVKTQSWSALPVPSAADPVWSPDSRHLYAHASLEPSQPLVRISIPEGHVDQVVSLTSVSDAVDFIFSGLLSDGTPVVRTIHSSGDIYAKDLK